MKLVPPLEVPLPVERTLDRRLEEAGVMLFSDGVLVRLAGVGDGLKSVDQIDDLRTHLGLDGRGVEGLEILLGDDVGRGDSRLVEDVGRTYGRVLALQSCRGDVVRKRLRLLLQLILEGLELRVVW
jgi:hypothetical protein